MKRVYVAGGSGGHILPAMTMARQHPHDEHYFVALDRDLDRSLLAGNDWITQTAFLSLDTIRLRAIRAYPAYGAQLGSALRISWDLLAAWKPDEIVSMGGYISVPFCSVAWLRGIPIRLYELNAEVGTAVRMLSPSATEILCCFDEAAQRVSQQVSWLSWIQRAPRVTTAAYPMRYTAGQKVSRAEACAQLGLDTNHPVLLVLGGSQGSDCINGLIISWLYTLSASQRHTIQIIHQTGSRSYDFICEQYAQFTMRSIIFAYREDLATCYAASSCAISRAGSGAIHELTWFGVSTLLVPLDMEVTEHQYFNACAAVMRHSNVMSMVENDSERGRIFQWLTQSVLG